MERERSRQEQTADTDKLYPQIAEALNISISQLEQYPSDMKQILCQAYINNCELGKDDVAEALNGIVNLDVDEVGIKEVEKQQDNTAVDNELRQTEVTERKTNGHFYSAEIKFFKMHEQLPTPINQNNMTVSNRKT